MGLSPRMCRRCKERPADPEPERGMYAGLCGQCQAEARASAAARAAAAGQSAKPRRSYTSRTDEAGQETFEAKARVLVSYGRQLDRRIEDVKKTKRGHLDAISLARESMEQFKAACLRLAESAGG